MLGRGDNDGDIMLFIEAFIGILIGSGGDCVAFLVYTTAEADLSVDAARHLTTVGQIHLL